MSEFDDTSDLTDDECRQLLRAVAHERDALQTEVERLLDLLERAGSCLHSWGLRDEVFAAIDAARGES